MGNASQINRSRDSVRVERRFDLNESDIGEVCCTSLRLSALVEDHSPPILMSLIVLSAFSFFYPLTLLPPGSFILSPPLPSPLCWFVFSHVIQRPRNREAESWNSAEQIHSLFNAERHQDVQQSQATHVTHRPITNRSCDSGAEVRAIVLLSYVTLPFNVGRPFCLMDVSQWLHNFQPKRPKLCMHIPEQCL